MIDIFLKIVTIFKSHRFLLIFFVHD
jgi:hypothetical protein